MKVTVEKDLCIKCGACMQIASEVFGYSPEGHSEVKNEVVEAGDKSVIMAMEACPTGAIRVEGDAENIECSCEHCDSDICECEENCDCEHCSGCECEIDE